MTQLGQGTTIRKEIVAGYSDPAALRGYRVLGLQQAEEILIAAHFPAGSRLLDIGCGAGRTSIPLWKMGYRVHAIDITPAMIGEAQRMAERYRAEVDFQVMDVTDLRFADGTFDGALFSYNGIDHLPRREGKLAALREVRRVLRPEGAFVFSTHSLLCRGREAVLWRRVAIKYSLARLLRIPIREQELGEIYDDASLDLRYLDVLPRRIYTELLVRAGFRLLRSVSGSELEAGRPVSFWARYLRQEEFVFYVAERPRERL